MTILAPRQRKGVPAVLLVGVVLGPTRLGPDEDDHRSRFWRNEFAVAGILSGPDGRSGSLVARAVVEGLSGLARP